MSLEVNIVSQDKVILIIEDSPTQALKLSAMLERNGLQTICATNGRMGLALAHQVHPKLILLDVQMPDIDGFQVCRLLKGEADTADIPVIILARVNDLDIKNIGLETGALDYIPKGAFADAILVEMLRQMGIINHEI